MSQPARSTIRLAELIGALSLGTDLGMGQPMEHILRQCLISMRLAQRLGLDDADREVVYYASLLAWVGCHVDAYEQAKRSTTARAGRTPRSRWPGSGAGLSSIRESWTCSPTRRNRCSRAWTRPAAGTR